MQDDIYNLVGIGSGPFNLSLAALLEDTSVKSLFLDKQEIFGWHKGMQLSGATIQNSKIRDLVSLAEPTNYFSFNNFLYQNGRLEAHTIANFQHTMRWEYEQYLAWVIKQLDNVKLGCKVEYINPHQEGFEISYTSSKGKSQSVYAKNISLGIGVEPLVPSSMRRWLGDRFFHNSVYQFQDKKKAKNVLIIGGGQSALEVAIDLLTNYDQLETIRMVFQEPFIAQIEDSQFAEDCIYTGAGLQSFFDQPHDLKKTLSNRFSITSDGASLTTIEQLYKLLYTNRFYKQNAISFEIKGNSRVFKVNCFDKGNDNFEVHFEDILTRELGMLEADMVILATGYEQRFPKYLFSEKILEKITFIDDKPSLSCDYNLRYNGTGSIFYMNGAKHTHGVVDPNLSLNALRARAVVNSLVSIQDQRSTVSQQRFTL